MFPNRIIMILVVICRLWQDVVPFNNPFRSTLPPRQYKILLGSRPDSFQSKQPSKKPQQEKTKRELITEMSEPLLNEKLLKSTIEDWTRPLPPYYFSSPLVLVGPSGVGKGRLVRSLMKDYSRFFKKVVTHTTRQPRRDEIPGISYHYVSLDTFNGMVAEGEFLEWAQVHDNYYGTTIKAWQEVQSQQKIAIMEIDVQGAKSIKKLADSFGIRPKYLFFQSPNLQMLHERLIRRGSETPEQITLRLKNAEIEMAEAQEVGLFDHILIITEDFGENSNAFFRLMRTWYRALPSVSKIRMLQRRIKNIRQLASAIKEEDDAANAGSQELAESAESAVLIPNHDSKDSESTNPVTASGGKPE